MPEYGLQPSYGRLDYHSSYGPHSQTIPTKQWLQTSITGELGSYINWDSDAIDAEEMWDAYVDEAKGLLPTTSGFDLVTIFNWDTVLEKFLPVASKSLSVAGTATPANVNKAVSLTLNLRTLGGQPMKLVYLDYVLADAEFNKIAPAAFSTPMDNVVNIVTQTVQAFSGRDNTRPATAISGTFDLNDALRKQYRMV